MKRLILPTLLLAALAALAVMAVRALDLDYRIDAFLPVPADPDQALVVDQIGAGPGARMILVALTGASAGELATISDELAERWRRIDGVQSVRNSNALPDEDTLDRLMRARFLLVDDIPERLGPTALEQALDERLSDLALGGRQVEALVRRDPLGLIPELADRLAPATTPASFDGVWFDAAHERALLLVESGHPAFDSEAQSALVGQLRETFDELAPEAMQLTLAGPVIIGLDSAERSRSEATRLSIIGSAFLLLVLILAWRSASLLIAGALPLAAGVVAGLATVALAFDRVHGLTLAFGFTLLGVVLDYPVHLFGHAAGRRLDQAAREIAGPLLLGAASTLIAYLAIWSSTSSGLAQLGAFSAAGLTAAALTTLLLPWLGLSAPNRLIRRPPPRLHQPLLVWLAAILALGWLAWQGEARWSSDLSRLSPVDRQLLADDIELRQALGAGNVGQLLVLSAPDRDRVLAETEAVVAQLREARAMGLITAWQSPTDLLPSSRTQAERRAAWPTADWMATALAEAEPRFQPQAFQPFLEDLDALAALPELDPDYWRGSGLAGRIDGLLSPVEDGWRALILPVGLDDPDAFRSWLAERGSKARLVELRQVSESMVEAYRMEAGQRLLLAAALIAGLILLRLRNLRDTLAVIAPPLAAALCTAAIMSSWHSGLSIVHLIGLLLAAGIGLDFALFNRMMARRSESGQRTRRALLVCAISSGGVFLILGQSTIGMLDMLGLTVATGVLLSWLFARLTSAPPASR
ncbi:MMPL family transporter [Wenzhouxiangella marina]|uniref:Uncharacterized protein n=1 Tax=Wenzhouxiangella marina TaxID=1579979 RepID=A0A0K0Y0A1_9GAMM|nr:hypothetical protein [Wenzhouxiangella marina]AKS43364.1 hypothetical protein WM2015_3012 [Wenzhouxiangella marina]MBB6088520.1 putative exporter [Wenzhouxiangella marina]